MSGADQTIPNVLVACIGNIFLGDDAFGCAVARELAGRHLPPGVRVVDFGIRGLDLAYAILDGCNAVVLVDAMPRGGPPGTLYVVEPEVQTVSPAPEGLLVGAHSLTPDSVLRLVAALGGRVDNVRLVGCEPSPAPLDDDFQADLSPAVRAAVPDAANMTLHAIQQMLAGKEAEPFVTAPAASESLRHGATPSF